MELYYRRNNGNLETVVYFLPDTSGGAIPGQNEWDSIRSLYRIALYGKDGGPAPKEPNRKEQQKTLAIAVKVEDEEESWEPKSDETSGGEVPPNGSGGGSTAGQPGIKEVDATGGGAPAATEGGDKSTTEELDEILRMEVAQPNKPYQSISHSLLVYYETSYKLFIF
jgi:hypothetical protein